MNIFPPEAAFNSQRRKMSTIEEWMKDKTENRSPWGIEGGVYFDLIKGIGAEIMKIPKEEQFGSSLYLHAGRIDRLISSRMQLNGKTGSMEVFSEISTFPVGFIFYNILENHTTTFHGCDIISFSQCDYNSLYNLNIQISFLEYNTPFGLDFRKF